MGVHGICYMILITSDLQHTCTILYVLGDYIDYIVPAVPPCVAVLPLEQTLLITRCSMYSLFLLQVKSRK